MLRKEKKELDPTSNWKTLSELNYSIKYPPEWFYVSGGGGGVRYFSNFKTNTCTDEDGNPINVLVDKICVSLVVTEQISGIENFPLQQYLNRQFGKYDPETKSYSPIPYEKILLRGDEAAKLVNNNSLNYLIRKNKTLLQISMVPENSSLGDQFELMLSTLQLRIIE